MSQTWSTADIVDAVRSHLTKSFEHRGLVAQVELVDQDVVVVLRGIRGNDRSYGVQYSLQRLPRGPATGEVCESVGQWAIEVGWDLGEAIGTREIESAESAEDTAGRVLLRWWPGEAWSR